MNTRLTGNGFHDAQCPGIQQASSALSFDLSTNSPSIPAVERPALICVTRRTLSRAFARDRNINL